MHLAFEPSGKVVPCCLTSHHNYFAGDLTTQPINEIWNSDNMKKLRVEMINGIAPSICSTCFDSEKVTGDSSRIHHTRDFPTVIEQIPTITEEDGTCTSMELKYWDFRFSNICNFKCRSCGPRYSSAWIPDAKKLGHISDQDKVWNINAVDEKPNFDFLTDQIQHVEKIYFAGGEPLLMDEHWKILDMLVENKKFDVRLSYNTNCSTLSYAGKNVFDYWKQWNHGKVEIWPSIDEIGERAELIRAGTNWANVEGNLKLLTTLPNIIVRPGLTIGAWNVDRLPEIINHLVDIGVVRDHNKEYGINYNNFFINLLSMPRHYHVSILPDERKLEIIDKLEAFIIEHEERYTTRVRNRFTQILHELTLPYNDIAATKFLEITHQIDNIRGEDTFAVIPEMNVVKESVSVPYVYKRETPHHTPETLKSAVINKKIVEIVGNNNQLLLTWIINNICTNHCSYCPVDVHTGTNHNYEWEHAKIFIEKCFDKYADIHFNIAGGEPTVSPFFKDLIHLIRANRGTIHLTTNLVRTKEYWSAIAENFITISASYHPEYIITNKQEDEFIEKVIVLSSKTRVTVRVMMLPERWDQCYNFYQKLITGNIPCIIEVVRILPNFGVGEDYCDINYTDDQSSWINATRLIDQTLLTPEILMIGGRESVVIYDDSTTDKLTHERTVSLINNTANFKNWECDIGLESLFVFYNGNIKLANCNVGGTIGNITKLSAIKWPTNSIICNKSICHCAADLLISKRKSN